MRVSDEQISMKHFCCRSVDVVLYPTINKSLNTESTLMEKLKTRLSPFYDQCNGCSRYHFIDIVGRIKFKEELDIENAIQGAVGKLRYFFDEYIHILTLNFS
jgi:hypothetical protein